MKAMTNLEAIKSSINLNIYNKKKGDYIETPNGDFYVLSAPNLYQPVAERFWLFEQCTDETGEPLMNGEQIKIKLS